MTAPLLLATALLTTTACRHGSALRGPPDGCPAVPCVFSEERASNARRWCTRAEPTARPGAQTTWRFARTSVTGPLARLAPGATGAPPAARTEAPRPPSVCDPEAWQRAVCLHRARRKSTVLAAGGVGAVLGYGLLFWNYGSNPFHFKDDGLFGEETEYGGADKAGHVVAAGIHTAVFSAINRAWGIPREEAALRGALTAFAVLAMIEVGDGFTKVHGFNYGDLVADATGCLFGYFHERYPWFARTFDLRWEYWPTDQVWSGEDLDLTTDYEGASYILAINVGSVVGRPRSLLDLLDVQVGYNTRHYVDHAGDPERNVLLGVGVNFSNLFRRIGWRVPAKIFEYYQIPDTSLRLSFDLND